MVELVWNDPQEKKQYKCNQCEKSFITSGDLKGHTKVHSDVYDYSCPICKKTFKQQRLVKSHMRVHSEETVAQCDFCDQKFKRKSALKGHLMTHTGEKPHQCTVCNEHFARADTLKFHFRRHTKEKPYECTICDKKFAQKSALTSHEFSHRDKEKHSCIICKKQFLDRVALNRHTKKVHAQIIPTQDIISIKEGDSEDEMLIGRYLNSDSDSESDADLIHVLPGRKLQAEKDNSLEHNEMEPNPEDQVEDLLDDERNKDTAETIEDITARMKDQINVSFTDLEDETTNMGPNQKDPVEDLLQSDDDDEMKDNAEAEIEDAGGFKSECIKTEDYYSDDYYDEDNIVCDIKIEDDMKNIEEQLYVCPTNVESDLIK